MSGGARAAALEAIRRVLEEGAYSNLAIDAVLGRAGLDERDRSFATELAYGTLRRRLVLEPAIEQRASRPLARMTDAARRLLLLGAYQLRFTGVVPYAAVDETVALAGPRERGFVNAILRRLAAEPPAPPLGEDVAAIQARTGMVAWAVRELQHLVGSDAEDAAAALAEQAPLSLRVNRCRAAADVVLRELAPMGAEPGRHDPHAVLLRAGRPSRLPGWDRGAFAVMDEASSLVAATVGAQPGDRVLDACAGPGGKTGALACDVVPGGLVVAGDLYPARAGLVRSTLDRLGVPGSVVAHDATKPPLRGGFDRILVDAPCSGLGSARRRPELLWRPRKDRLSSLARHQVEIAVACADLLRPGGRLVYAVCTFPRAETDAACDAIVRHRPELVPVETAGPDGPSLRHRLWPHLHGTDGMFYAAFQLSS